MRVYGPIERRTRLGILLAHLGSGIMKFSPESKNSPDVVPVLEG
jgi:hypothetical protein